MKKISAKILITQLVILCITLFIFPMKLKADEVSYPFFLYNVRHTYEEDNTYVHPFRHKYEFYIHANHEVTGRFIISITTPSGSSAHTWYCESGGEIYNNQIMDRSTGTTVFVTGQQYLKVTLMYLTDSAIDIMNVRSIQFSQTDLDGNLITTDQSLWSEVQKIEDDTFQLLSAVGFVNDNLTDVRSKLQSVITLMQTTNTKLDTLITSATNILNKVTSIDTALQNIDNTIDTISWNNLAYNFEISNDMSNWISSGYVDTNWSHRYLYLRIKGNILSTNLYNIRLGLGYRYANYYGPVQIDFGYISNNTYYPMESNNIYYPDSIGYSANKMNLYTSTQYNYTGSQYFVIRIKIETNAIRLYVPDSISYISNNDIEYWELLGYFNQYKFYNQQLKDNKSIIDKLSELILGNNTTNNSVSNNDQSNQQFNQQQQQYDQIESTFQSSFTTDQQAVQQTFNNNTLTIFADTTLWFTQQLNALYNASGQMKILFTMPLLLGLALFFIGRGAKVSAPNTVESYYSYEQTANVDGVKYYRFRKTSGAHKLFHGFNRK